MEGQKVHMIFDSDNKLIGFTFDIKNKENSSKNIIFLVIIGSLNQRRVYGSRLESKQMDLYSIIGG